MALFQAFRGTVDERFLLHRYKSTSHAGVLAALVMGGWFFYDQIVNGVIRTDFVIVLSVMAFAKLTFMAWYHMRD